MRWFSRVAMPTTATKSDKTVQEDETEMFRATLDLRNIRHGDDVPDSEAVERQEPSPPAASCAKTFWSKLVNSSITRNILLLVILGILMYLLERLGGDEEQLENVRASLRNVFKAAVAPLTDRNVTTTTTTTTPGQQ
jgi:hypothetical protein